MKICTTPFYTTPTSAAKVSSISSVTKYTPGVLELLNQAIKSFKLVLRFFLVPFIPVSMILFASVFVFVLRVRFYGTVIIIFAQISKQVQYLSSVSLSCQQFLQL